MKSVYESYGNEEESLYVARIYNSTEEIHLFRAKLQENRDGTYTAHFQSESACGKIESQNSESYTSSQPKKLPQGVMTMQKMRIACGANDESKNICGLCMSHLYKTDVENDYDNENKTTSKSAITWSNAKNWLSQQ